VRAQQPDTGIRADTAEIAHEAQVSNGSVARPLYQVSYRLSPRDEALYERLIWDGIAAAEGRGSPVDHVTARRLAIVLAARPQPPEFVKGLAVFIQTGAIGRGLKNELRIRSRSAVSADRSEAEPLMAYCAGRADLGPVSENFAHACDQIDRSDVMLQGLRERGGPSVATPPGARQDSQQIFAVAGRDPESRTVSLVLDEGTANLAMFAIAAHAEEREAHVREVKRYGQALPEGSYGRRNRENIAAREERVAARLRAVEQAYRIALERDALAQPPQPAIPAHPSERSAGREAELG